MLITLVHIILIWINTITIIYLLCFQELLYTLFNIHISRIYHVSCSFKINVSTYQIRVVSNTRIISVYHRFDMLKKLIDKIIK